MAELTVMTISLDDETKGMIQGLSDRMDKVIALLEGMEGPVKMQIDGRHLLSQLNIEASQTAHITGE